MFSRRLPSLRDSLHFVKTRTTKGDGEKKEKAREKRYARAQRPKRASSPSRSLTTSAATERIGEGKVETMVWVRAGS